MESKFDIISLLKPRVSDAKANNIIAKLGFLCSYRVEEIGYSEGIWLGWKDSIQIGLIRNHPQFILARVWLVPSSKFGSHCLLCIRVLIGRNVEGFGFVDSIKANSMYCYWRFQYNFLLY